MPTCGAYRRSWKSVTNFDDLGLAYQEIIAEHLALAKQNVKAAKIAVERQREVVGRLSIDGHDITKAEATLRSVG
jgi:hypothetical protein